MTRTVKALFQELSLRQILMGSLLVVYLAAIVYSAILLSSLYRAKKDSASLKFTTELDRKQAELDRLLMQTRQDVEHLAQITRILASLRPEHLVSQMDLMARDVLRRSELHFSAYTSFEGGFSRRFFRKSGLAIGVSKNPELLKLATFNDPVNFKLQISHDPAYQTNPQELWYHQARDRPEPVLSAFYYDRIYTQQVVFSLTQGVFLPSGEFIGVAGIDTLAASLSDFLEKVRIGKTGGLILVDEAGIPIPEIGGNFRPIIDSSNRTRDNGRPSEEEPIPSFSTEANEFSSYRGRDGELYVTQARPLESAPWSLVAFQSSREAYHVPVTHTMILIALGVVFFAFFFWLGRQLASVLSGSVNNLVTNFNENSSFLAHLEKGSKLRPAFPKGPKEFQYLALKLNELYDRLSRSVTLLKQEANRAEKATEAKSRFLSVMSHEIRTPLNSMLGLTDVLGRTPLNPEQQKYLKVLQRSGENLLRILNDILDFSRLEAGKLEVDFHEFDLFDLINSVDQLKRLDAESKGIQLTIIPPPMNFILLGDSTRLRQILLNLVGNAIKFTEKGEVILKVSPLLHIDASHQTFLFEVKDTGIGIPEKRLKAIFQEFSQADRSISRRFGGTGLGLTITQQLLGLFRSRLEVRSGEGRGSTFSFKLDLPVRSKFPAEYASDQILVGTRRASDAAPPPASSPAPTALSVRDAGQKTDETSADSRLECQRILLVDDDEDNHRLMNAYMRFHQDVSFDHSYHGMDALQKFETGDYDLIFMDMQMPQMDGLEAVRRIRAVESDRGTQKRVPIVMVSANTFADDQRVSLEAGADEHVAKPIKLDRFTALLQKYLKKPSPQTLPT